MRLTQVSVKRLFGTFTHIIPLHLDDRITILHGPNGFGKTALLRIIDALFHERYSEILSTPFEEFRLVFDNPRSTLTITKAPPVHHPDPQKTKPAGVPTIEYRRGSKDFAPFLIRPQYDQRELSFSVSIIEHEVIPTVACRVVNSAPHQE